MSTGYRDGIHYMQATSLDGVGLVHAQGVSRGISRHAHDSLCFGAVLAGAREFIEGETTVTVRAGQVLAINPQQVHACGMDGPCSYVMFSVRPDALGRAMAQIGLPAAPLPRIRNMVIHDPALYSRIVRLAEITLRHGDPLESQTLYLDILARLLTEHAGLESPALPDEPEAVTRARDYLDEHFAQGISLADLARSAGLSPFHLSRVFTARTGLPPHEYQTARRIRRAKQLLEAGEPAAQVAAACGFSDQSHLSRAFKRIMGMTPGQYAEAHDKHSDTK